MLRIFVCLLLVCPCFAVQQAYAQFTSNNGKENQHLLRTQNVPGVRQHYALAETTAVTRIEPNKPPMEYQREIVYYFSQLAKESPKKGFTTIEVNVDSMSYRMKSGDSVWQYTSQQPEGAVIQLTPDMEIATAVLNRPFTLTLSPYGEITTIESQDIDWLKKYVVVEGRTMLDTVKKFRWLEAVSFPVLAGLGDVRSNLLPFTFVGADSTWQRAVAFRTNSVDFQDSARVSFATMDEERYTLQARADSLHALQGQTTSFGIDGDFTRVLGGNGTGTGMITVNRYGVVEKANWALQVSTSMQHGKQTFTEKIRTVHSLTLIGQYRW